MDLGRIYIITSIKRFVKLHKDIISPRVSDTLASKVEGKNVL